MSQPFRLAHSAFYCAFFSSFLALASCTKSDVVVGALTPQPEKPYYVFALDEVKRFHVVRQFPGEEAWSVKLEREGNDWTIRSAPYPLLDSRADTAFVNHLLDTLKTFSPIQVAPRGELSSYGLDPARARLQWGSLDENRNYILSLGNEEKTGNRFALFAPGTPVMIAQGATLQMLAYMKDWQFLRRKIWILGEIDDVDAIQAKAMNGKEEKFERSGTGWTKAKMQTISTPLAPALTNLFHQRVVRFVDSAVETDALTQRFSKISPVELRLIDRQDHAQILKIYSEGTEVFGRNSERGESWVELYPLILQPLSAFTQVGSTPRKSGTK